MGKIQVKRGLKVNLPAQADAGELLYTTDEKNLYVGNGVDSTPTEIPNKETVESLIDEKLGEYDSHEHAVSSITDFASSVETLVNSKKGVANGLATLDSTGKIPSTQIPKVFKEAEVVDDIAARDQLDAYSGLHVLVVDATDDSTVETGGAEYVYNGTKWVKISEFNETDLHITWEDIQNKPEFASSFTQLSDAPSSLTDGAGKLIGVNQAGTALEFKEIEVDGGTF